MKDNIIYLDEENKKYPITFTLNVMDILQEKYGSIDAWKDLVVVKEQDKEPKIKDLKFAFTEMMNEAIRILNKYNQEDKMDFVDAWETGIIISEIGLKKVNEKMMNTIASSVKVDNPKNA